MSNSSLQDTTQVRSGHEINVGALESYLVKHCRIQGPLSVSQFKHGQSNPTYMIQDSNNKKYVLRKKPPGALLSKTAHAIEREYRILHALGTKTDIPVPMVYALCEDPKVIGTPFYVMEFLEGRIFQDILMPSLSPEDRRKCWFAAMETLAKLHKVDYNSIGLSDYGRHSGFYDRQIRTLTKISEAQAKVKDIDSNQQVGPLPHMKEMLAWFERNQVSDKAAIVHGDYRIDNLIFHPTEPRVIGVLDWELSTIGHPYSDLANVLVSFYMNSISIIPGYRDAKEPLGIPTVEELMQTYCRIVGEPYPIPRWTFALSFCLFRFAVIAQGIAARVARKQASSGHAQTIAKTFQPLSEAAFELISRGDLPPHSSKL